jgi:general secretion pathway protein K
MTSSQVNMTFKLFNKKLAGDETGGMAVILVIWIVVILMAMVGEFTYSMRTEINITRNFKEEEEAYQLAIAGIEQAKLELLLVNDLRGIHFGEDDVLILDLAKEEEEVLPERERALGRGSFEYTITDEDGKLNINSATQEQLRSVFMDSGVELEEVDTIVDSILDWIDTNDLHRLSGAEEDYYQSLDQPYSCKDDKFEKIEELLLVKGMTPEIFYGSHAVKKASEEIEEEDEPKFSGVVDLLTVVGSGSININTSPEPVLVSVMGSVAANNIILQRDVAPLFNAGKNGKVDSQYFTITSTGKNSDESIKRTIKTVVLRQPKNLVIIYWDDNFIG